VSAAAGVTEAAADELVAEVSTDAEFVVADAVGVDGVDSRKARDFFCCISQT
jgi:hypothetical protein